MCIVLVVFEICSAASQSKRQQPSSYDHHQHAYQYDSNPDHPDYSYSETLDYETQEKKCYYCEYTVLATLDIREGMEECNDPFTGKGVPEIPCSHACSVCI